MDKSYQQEGDDLTTLAANTLAAPGLGSLSIQQPIDCFFNKLLVPLMHSAIFAMLLFYLTSRNFYNSDVFLLSGEPIIALQRRLSAG